MTQQFTASEVRESAIAVVARDMEYEAGMLRAFADRLEADEKAEPVAWTRQDVISDDGGCPIGMDEPRIAWGAECPDYEGGWAPLYTHPQPAQDAALYQELLMAVSKKFPNESRHETALRYIKQNELQSCEPKCDAAMAKESGR